MKINFSTTKVLDFLSKRYLWIIGAVFLLFFIFNIYIYYQNIYLTLNTSIDSEDLELVPDRELFNQVLGVIEQRKEQLRQVKDNYYSNPFID